MAVWLRFGRILPMAGVAVLHFGGYVVVTEAALAASHRWQTQTALDAYVPHLPWMWPFYWAAYPFIILGGGFLLLSLPEAGFRRALAAYTAMILAGVGLQLAIPAHSPTPHLPHPGQALIHWSSLEQGFATLPSMHVAFCTLTAGIALAALTSVVLKSAYAVLAVLISVSTLTLQEHVVLDLATGLALGGIAALAWVRGVALSSKEASMNALRPTDPAQLYRLPWTASDNAMTWLEPTRRCNIVCDACFAENDPFSQKPLAQIQRELETMLRLRRCDAMLIAGGEPLTHPEIAEVVAMVHRAGVKPVLVTNGVLLDRPLLRRLKQAGAYGLTVHVDSHQARPGWEGRSETELNALRSSLADMIHEEGGLTCAFNTTVFPDALEHVPAIVRWALERPDRVQVLTLICVRTADVAGPFQYYAGGRPVDLSATPYASATRHRELTTEDLCAGIRQALPDFEFCAYLGGTVQPQSLKWAVGCRIAAGGKTYGYMGPRAMELLQGVSHAVRGRFLAYTRPRTSRMGRSTLLLGAVDPALRSAALRFAGAMLRRPWELLRPLHLQSLSVVQPVDILPNGEMDTCDGCPNKTYWNERLVAACRLDEYKRYGAPVHAAPRASA